MLTLPQARKLILAALSGDQRAVEKALQDLAYTMKRNFTAYRSHRKRRLHLLE